MHVQQAKETVGKQLFELTRGNGPRLCYNALTATATCAATNLHEARCAEPGRQRSTKGELGNSSPSAEP